MMHGINGPFNGGVHLIQHKAGGATHQHGAAHQAQGRPHAIHIRVPVADDKHLIRGFHQLAQGLGEQPGLDPGIPGGHLPLAPIKGIAGAPLHHRLVASPAQGQLHPVAGGFFRGGDPVGHPHGYGQGDGLAGAGIDLPHRIQQGEALPFQLRQPGRLKHHEKFGYVVASIHPVDGADKIADLPLHLGKHRVPVELLIRVQVVIVVDLDDGHSGHLLFIQPGIMEGLRPIHPILKGQMPDAPAGSLDSHVHQLEAAAVIIQGLGLIGIARVQPGDQTT